MLFTFRMELATGEPADPPKFETSVSNWREGDSVFVSPKLRYRVVDVRSGADGEPALVVEPAHSEGLAKRLAKAAEQSLWLCAQSGIIGLHVSRRRSE